MKVTIINGGLVSLFLATALSREVREIGPGVAYEHDGGEFALLDNNPLVELHRRADEAAERARREVIQPEFRKPDPVIEQQPVDTASPDAPSTGVQDPGTRDTALLGDLGPDARTDGGAAPGAGAKEPDPKLLEEPAPGDKNTDFQFPRGGDNTTDK